MSAQVAAVSFTAELPQLDRRAVPTPRGAGAWQVVQVARVLKAAGE